MKKIEVDPALIKYDAACRAIAAAKRVDEVKTIRDVSIAMRAYARQAHNHELEADAVEIRLRATRRMDQMRQEQKATVGLNRGARGIGTKVRGDFNPTLAETGIDKNLAKEGRKLGAMSEPQFEGAIAAAREATNRVIKDAIKGQSKKLSRAERELVLAQKQQALPDKRYGVILADPPWSFEPYNRESGMDRAADNHYPTMPTVEIENLDVSAIAADDCVLFLWATVPMLGDAMRVLGSWGFTYKSHLIWNKDKAGTGFWARNKHELLLIAVRGNVPAPAPGEQPESVIDAPRLKHSAKPTVFYSIIEQMFPNLPRIELFARDQIPGWDAWGNESPQQAA